MMAEAGLLPLTGEMWADTAGMGRKAHRTPFADQSLWLFRLGDSPKWQYATVQYLECLEPLKSRLVVATDRVKGCKAPLPALHDVPAPPGARLDSEWDLNVRRSLGTTGRALLVMLGAEALRICDKQLPGHRSSKIAALALY